MDLDGLQLLLDAVKQLDQKPFELPTATASQIPSACCFEEVKSTPAGGCSPSRSVQDDPENQNNCSRHDNHERPSANDMRDESQSEDIHINDSRNETAAISFSLFACLPQRLASTPMYGRSDPQMEFSNPMDLSIASTMTADEGPLDLSIGPHVTDHSVEAIDLVLPRIPEKSLSPAIPLDLRSAKSSLPDPTSDLQCKYSRLQESQASTKQVGIADAAKMSKISPLKRKPIETEVDSSTKKKSEKSQGNRKNVYI
ncbi:uncharacterized protein LOC110674261 [Aedes aegypti]|uniref:Uncharacterized protein n=1 Tax=Aedes aegypti TaxID=7159 RepID=A0A6I8U4P9_AEDAE|nr:uncharacterized protein LOC110674261 [Aedes aegypti]